MEDVFVHGQRIRAERKKAGLTLEALAKEAGISAGHLSLIERNLATPSLVTLRNIASALKVSAATLLMDSGMAHNSPGGASQVRVLHPGERKRFRWPRSRVVQELLTPDIGGNVFFVWADFEPGDSNPTDELSTHPGEEHVLCVEGSIVIVLGTEEFTLNRGDSLSYSPLTPHRLENRSSSRASVVAAISPPRL